jgi:hypothetical protein
MKSSFLILFLLAGILQSCYAGVSYLAPRSHLEKIEYLSGFHRPGDPSPIHRCIDIVNLHDVRKQLISVPSLIPGVDESLFRQGLRRELGPHKGKILLLKLSKKFDQKTHFILSQVAGECGVGLLYLVSRQSLTEEWIPQDPQTQLFVVDRSSVSKYYETLTILSDAPLLSLDFHSEKESGSLEPVLQEPRIIKDQPHELPRPSMKAQRAVAEAV